MAIINCEYFSQARCGYESFIAILPVDPPPKADGSRAYAASPWPTLYLLHGFSGSRSAWLRGTDIEKWVAEHACAVVMPDGGNRFYIDNEETGERYGAMVGQELVDVTRRMFSLSRAREDTAIGGLSMGGFGAILNGLRYADTFGAVIALSSALITDEVAGMTPEGGGNNIAPYGYYRNTFGEPSRLLGTAKDPKHLARERANDAERPRMFLACGSEDFLYPNNLDFHQHLTAIGYSHEWWVRPGVHDYVFWSMAMRAAMEWWKGGVSHEDRG